MDDLRLTLANTGLTADVIRMMEEQGLLCQSLLNEITVPDLMRCGLKLGSALKVLRAFPGGKWSRKDACPPEAIRTMLQQAEIREDLIKKLEDEDMLDLDLLRGITTRQLESIGLPYGWALRIVKAFPR